MRSSLLREGPHTASLKPRRGRLVRGRLSQLQGPSGDRLRLEQFQNILLVSRCAMVTGLRMHDASAHAWLRAGPLCSTWACSVPAFSN